uniref:Uncharacterized protein n=1 Tax=Oryza sativa subsp. japonica TaxID=39947 RepID=Q6EUJ9_ORYSJ|nr:hypothetical protein [Oryza sativa Japonica Group]
MFGANSTLEESDAVTDSSYTASRAPRGKIHKNVPEQSIISGYQQDPRNGKEYDPDMAHRIQAHVQDWFPFVLATETRRVRGVRITVQFSSGMEGKRS